MTEKKRWRVCEVFLSVMAILAAAWGILPAASGEAVTVIYVTQTGAGLRNGVLVERLRRGGVQDGPRQCPCGERDLGRKGNTVLPFLRGFRRTGRLPPRKSGGDPTAGAGGETNTRQRDFRKSDGPHWRSGGRRHRERRRRDGDGGAGIQGKNSYTVVSSWRGSPQHGNTDGHHRGSADWTDTNTGGAKQYGGRNTIREARQSLRNCSFRETRRMGAGRTTLSNIRLGYCTFSGNGGRSGAMYNVSSSPELVSCTFRTMPSGRMPEPYTTTTGASPTSSAVYLHRKQGGMGRRGHSKR